MESNTRTRSIIGWHLSWAWSKFPCNKWNKLALNCSSATLSMTFSGSSLSDPYRMSAWLWPSYKVSSSNCQQCPSKVKQTHVVDFIIAVSAGWSVTGGLALYVILQASSQVLGAVYQIREHLGEHSRPRRSWNVALVITSTIIPMPQVIQILYVYLSWNISQTHTILFNRVINYIPVMSRLSAKPLASRCPLYSPSNYRSCRGESPILLTGRRTERETDRDGS